MSERGKPASSAEKVLTDPEKARASGEAAGAVARLNMMPHAVLRSA